MRFLIEFVITVVIGVISYCSFHYGFGWTVGWSTLAAIVCMAIGYVVIAFVEAKPDHGGDPWDWS